MKQPYVAEKMGVTASTIQRYEAGTIDNTKKLVLDGLSEALHVSVEWLKGEAEEELKVSSLSNNTVTLYLGVVKRIKEHPLGKRKLKTVTSEHMQE